MSMNNLGSVLGEFQSGARRKNPNHNTAVMAAENIWDLGDAREALSTRLDAAIPKRYRNARVEHPEIRAWVEEYLECPQEARSLMVMGNVGSGKTWAAYGALREAALRSLKPNRAGVYILGNWEATTFPDFIAKMRPRAFTEKDEMTSEKFLTGMRSVQLLLVDDIGVGKQTDWTEDVTHRLVSGRYDEELPTIYTTNLTPKELDDVIGARMTSRLAEECRTVRLVGADRRRAR